MRFREIPDIQPWPPGGWARAFKGAERLLPKDAGATILRRVWEGKADDPGKHALHFEVEDDEGLDYQAVRLFTNEERAHVVADFLRGHIAAPPGGWHAALPRRASAFARLQCAADARIREVLPDLGRYLVRYRV